MDVREKENNESGERTDTRFRVMGREEEVVGKDGDVDILYLGGMKGFQERGLFACHSVRHINDLLALLCVSYIHHHHFNCMTKSVFMATL